MKHLTKENFYISYLRFFYDIPEDLDEYQINELNRFGSQMFLLIFSLMWASLFIPFLTLIDISEITTLIVFFLPSYYQGKMIKRLGLDKIEIEANQLKETKRKMLKRTIGWKSGIIFAIGMYGATVLGDLFDLNGTTITRASQPKSIFYGLFCGLFFTLLAKFLAWYKKEVDDDKS